MKLRLQHMLIDPMIATVIQVIKHLPFLVMKHISIVQQFVKHILQPWMKILTNVNVKMVLSHWIRMMLQTPSGVI